MQGSVPKHYSGGADLVAVIAESLRKAGRNLTKLVTADLSPVDEFHIRGRRATLELGEALNLGPLSHLLDIGSGLGGPARTMAETYGCRVTGIDLTPEFCDAATALSSWVGLDGLVSFRQGDATDLPFADASFDAAMTIHVAMNIAAKNRMYAEARRVLKPGARFAVYDVLQGNGGAIHFPVPWARDPAISHLATPDEMVALLTGAGFTLVETRDFSDDSLLWFEALPARLAHSAPAVSIQTFLGNDFPAMTRNQILNLREDRIRTVSFICEA